MTGRALALAVLDYLDVPPPVFVETAAAAGFTAVTVRVAGTTAPVRADLSHSAELRRATRRALERTGLRVLDAEVVRMGPDLTRTTVQAIAEVAAELGAEHLLVVNAQLDDDESVSQLGLIGEVAATVGVRACLEFMPFSRCRTLGEAVATVSAADVGAGVIVDALHLHRSGGGVAELRAAVEQHGSSLFPYVQLCDAPASCPDPGRLREEALAGRLLPGEGDLPLAELLAALAPNLPVAVEAPSVATRGLTPDDRARATFDAASRLLTFVDGGADAT